MTLVLIALAMLLPASAQEVSVREGNIYLQTNTGERQLTFSGRDDDPSLAPSGRSVVFVRHSAGGGNASSKADSVVVIDTDATRPRVLLEGPLLLGDRRFSSIGSPQFSPDERHLYFVIGDYAATTGAVVEVPVGTTSLRLVTEGLSCTVVGGGKYKGDLLIRQRRFKLSGTYYYSIFLFTPQGRELGLVGDGDDDVKAFLLFTEAWRN